MSKKYFFLLLLILLDLGYSFVQHYHISLDGDMAPIVVPGEWYRQVSIGLVITTVQGIKGRWQFVFRIPVFRFQGIPSKSSKKIVW